MGVSFKVFASVEAASRLRKDRKIEDYIWACKVEAETER
jgi:hypothetical protein